MGFVQRLWVASESGFTLVELLGVALIIMILSLFSVQVLGEVTDRVRGAKSSAELRTIEQALERHRADKGHYPNKLNDLVKTGYLKQDTTFVSPWSTKSTTVYYFYAVDDAANGSARAYALGDPGPAATCSTQAVLHVSAERPLPCGRSPGQLAWSFDANADLQLDGVPGSFRGHVSLRQYRSSCLPASKLGHTPGSSCDLKTEA